MKKVVRRSKQYFGQFIFFFLLYFSLGYVLFSMNKYESFSLHVSLVLFGVIYGFVCSEIFSRKDYGYYAYQIVAIPLWIIFIALNYNFLILIG